MIKPRLGLIVLLLALLPPVGIQGQAPEPRLTVAGDVATPLTLGIDELKSLPRTTVEVLRDGRRLKYDGVLVGELLKRAGVPLGNELRGDAIASYIVASASDGYRAVFSLAEVDPAFTHNDIIVADALDGKPLLSQQGPMRLVAPKDARGVRGVRLLQRIEVVRLKK